MNMLIHDVKLAAKEKSLCTLKGWDKYYSRFKGNYICSRRSIGLAQAKYNFFCTFNGDGDGDGTDFKKRGSNNV